MWDADADGYARGEGVAALVLKRLSQALADGDHVECVIRETGLNQDGKTPGITMPSASAQASLIRSTYARAGLDLRKRSDRPQYFEAHGTGTPAGDPIEAEAISTAFFGPDTQFRPSNPDDKLFVGGIKTVIGHTEGTAGLAAVIKASLSLQAGQVAPNRLLNRLSPKVEPFYGNLQIVTKARPWPRVSSVRRASVNSFGFGGANAHAILESFDNPTARNTIEDCFSPFVFSAASESALLASLQSYRDFLDDKWMASTLNFTPRDLTWTLSSRRSALSHRAVLPAATGWEALIGKLTEKIDALNDNSASSVQPVNARETSKLRVLGIFTGQGAQWPRMGAELLEKSPAARKILARLDRSLAMLPPADRPDWSLYDQLVASAATSQVYDASASQPLCSAVQIMLVDLLKAAGITFAGLVGHSSGEVAVAYAAGYLTAEDAIRVAYYRGLSLKRTSLDKKGAMMAVGTSWEDALGLCELPAFEGRIVVGASNAPSSVTLSGDADAIDEAKVVLDEEKKFNRVLKVDRAYHSHHMQPVCAPYVRSLEACNIKTHREGSHIRWVSSVFEREIDDVPAIQNLGGQYWASHLASPVKFAEALKKILTEAPDGSPLDGPPPYDLIVEVGPHPALKGPASQTLEECFAGQPVPPYFGTLSRGVDSVEAFSLTLGSIWASFGEDAVDFGGFDRFMVGEEKSIAPPRLVKGLPTYRWDHSRAYWHESRLSKAMRTSKDGPNELLGRRVMDGAPDQLRFKNVLKRREVEWLDGHQVQGQVVFPYAAYVSACVTAAMRLTDLKLDAKQEQKQQVIQSIEMQNFEVGSAITFGDDQDAGVETLVTLTDITWLHDEKLGTRTANAKFSFYSCPNNEALDMVNHAGCKVVVVVSDNDSDVSSTVPRKAPEEEQAMLDVEPDRFYGALEKLGYGYSGDFKGLKRMQRKLGAATGSIQNPDSSSSSLLLHPGTLDSGIQSIILAYCFPGDSMLRSMYVPTGIKRLVVYPKQCLSFSGQAVEVPFDARASIDKAHTLSGDVALYSSDGSSVAVLLEGLETTPLAHPTESNDLNIFTEMVWDVAYPDSQELLKKTRVDPFDPDLLFSLERVTYFYLRNLAKQFPASERAKKKLEWHHERLFAYVDHCLAKVDNGTSPFAKQEWARDTEDDVRAILDKYPTNIDLRLMRSVGENLPAVIRGETTMLEHMIRDNMLNDFYVEAHGMSRYTKYLACMASQVSHRFPHMNVLEIGAGTGGATKSFLKELGDGFATYTFTDVSSGFFAAAEKRFAHVGSRMNFQVLDIEKDIDEQGYAEGSYDLIIASLVLHATRKLEDTMRNVRRLLKPGGHLLLLEITENEQMRFGLIFGGLPGWWLGYEDGRAFSPCVGMEEWNAVLQKTGFSGIDTAIPHHDTLPVPLAILVAQAVDDRVDFLKQPLACPAPCSVPVIPHLTIVGGGGEKTTQLASSLRRVLASAPGDLCGEVAFVKTLQEVTAAHLPVGSTILCLPDIDEPTFKNMTPEKLRGFQKVFQQAANVLWITQGAWGGDPFARMVIGFGRTIVLEMLHLHLQFLDIAAADETPRAETIADALVRFVAGGEGGFGSDEKDPILYSSEPELWLDETTGKLLVPRVKLNKDQNHRYNSARRTIVREVSPQDSRVELLLQQDGSYGLFEATAPPLSPEEIKLDVDILYSADRAVEVDRNCLLFPVVARERHSNRRVLALSSQQASSTQLLGSFIVPGMVVPNGQDDAAGMLEAFYNELLVQSIMRDVSSHVSLVVLQPSSTIARAMHRIATDRGMNLLLVATTEQKPAETGDMTWHYVHPLATKMDVQLEHLLHTMVARSDAKSQWHVVNLGGAVTEALYHTLIGHGSLPSVVGSNNLASLTSSTARLPARSELVGSRLRSLLVDAKYGVQALRSSTSSSIAVVPLADVVDQRARNDQATDARVISWESLSLPAATVPIQVKPVDNLMHFRRDRTYWLVGMAGGLGLSLCEWMAQHGARHLVVSSRNPKVSSHWLAGMQRLGVHVKVVSNDISDRNSVHAVYNEICREMPPIGGIAHGAMVLHDTVFTELDMDRVNKVMRPKMLGAMHLEELFHNTDLEFFVFFSSMAAIVGNPGQSAYAAANMYMSSLACQRRRRGLNASALHVGAIMGNGYVTREMNQAQQEYLERAGNVWLSEQDFRQLFAEAILASQGYQGKSPEISTGLKMVEDSSESAASITWFRNPMFQHCVSRSSSASDDATGARSGAHVPVKAQLAEAVSPAEVHNIITEAFAAKLRSSLQVEEDRELTGLTADTLGIDSLVAVDIRSWFLKELQVEMPVLKILSGATVGELLAHAQDGLPKTLTPNLDPDNKDKAEPKDKKVAEKAKPVAKPAAKAVPKPSPKAEPKAGPKPTPREAPKETPVTMQQPAPKTVPEAARRTDALAAKAATPSSSSRSASPPTPSDDYRQVSVSPSPPSSNAWEWSEVDESEARSQETSAATSMTLPTQPTKMTTKSGSAITKQQPIAFAQSRFWFLNQYLQDASTAFNISLSIDLTGPIDVNKFSGAVKLLGQRHEALRTRFVAPDDHPDKSASADVVQEILALPTLTLETRRISEDSQAEEAYKQLQTYRYKLHEGETMRIQLLQKTPTSSRLLIGYHHINMDGASLEVILRELHMAYDSKPLPPRQSILQYPDFAQKQRQEFTSGKWAEELAFWRSTFSDTATLEPLPLLPMAKASRRSPLDTYASNTADFHIDQNVLQNIKATCARFNVTPFHFHLAIWYTLLIRLVGEDVKHLCIGISSANRGHGSAMQSVGMYLNLLPVLLEAKPRQTFTNVLQMVRDKATAAFRHGKVPFDVIVNELGVPRSTTHSPLFQTLVNYRPGISERRDFCGCEGRVTAFEQGQTAYDLSLDIIENPGGDCHVIIAGQAALYDGQHVDMVRDIYKQLLGSLGRSPATRLNLASLYDPEETGRALQNGQGKFAASFLRIWHTNLSPLAGPFFDYQWPQTLTRRIDDMVRSHGNKTALVDAGTFPTSTLTFEKMNKRINAIASALSKQQPPIGHGNRVGVFIDPSTDWACSLLAIWRLDAVYVPLDPRTGSARLAAITADCNPDLLIVHDATEKDSSTLGSFATMNIDHIPSTTIDVAVSTKPDSVAAIMYTSGSTGVPKGIVMKHSSFRNNIEIMTEKCSFQEAKHVTLQQSSYSFDMSLSQTLLTLCNGGALHVVPKQMRGDPAAISDLICKQGITFTIATPSEYISWIRHGQVDKLRQSRWMLGQTGGESVEDTLTVALRELGKPDLHLIDCYGPTEITFCAGSKDVDSSGFQVWPNYTVYIVDSNMQPVPIGMPGEVLIGGAGVVDGYLHSELDGRGFAKDNFARSELLKQGWTKMHRTGDLGRLRKEDGRLLLHGRIAGDTQVKLRGLRVDLREIEAALVDTSQGVILEAAVAVRNAGDNTGSEFLAAFVVTESGSELDEGTRQRILNALPVPQYMRPSILVSLPSLPTNASGKLDRATLKQLELQAAPGMLEEAVALSDTELRIKALWEEVISPEILSQHQVTPDSDFFHVGGTSMLLVQLRAKIQQTFGVSNISLFQLFDASSLKAMANLIQTPEAARNEQDATMQQAKEDQPIDWQEETALPNSLLRVPSSRHFLSQPEVVILTGATGFLGRSILARLLEDAVVQKVHCLAVRQPKAVIEKRWPCLFKCPKVVVHTGDLSKPHFGLKSEDSLQEIFSEAHAVIHNGADVSFMKTYRSLRPANLDSTKELVRLSLPHQLSFHYISTAAVTHLTGQEIYEARSVGQYPPPADPQDGYLATKWASERYLEKVSDRCELPIWIHRPSSITGDGAPETDLLSTLLRASRSIKAVPETPHWRGWINLVSVGRVAMQIADQVYEDYSWPGNVKYLFESGEQEIPLADIKGVLERESGGARFEVLGLEEWIVRAEGSGGLNPLLAEYLRKVKDVPMVFPGLVQESNFF